MCWLHNLCIVYKSKTKDCAGCWTFQHKSWYLCSLLWCLPGFIIIPFYNYGEMEKFSSLALDGDKAIYNLKTLLANIAKWKQETTEKQEKQRERAHQRKTFHLHDYESSVERLQSKKPCFHCHKVGNHHIRVCPQRFSSNEENETLAMCKTPQCYMKLRIHYCFFVNKLWWILWIPILQGSNLPNSCWIVVARGLV